eukprot:365043-Chlamydomonas_euryale.AAC.5
MPLGFGCTARCVFEKCVVVFDRWHPQLDGRGLRRPRHLVACMPPPPHVRPPACMRAAANRIVDTRDNTSRPALLVAVPLPSCARLYETVFVTYVIGRLVEHTHGALGLWAAFIGATVGAGGWKVWICVKSVDPNSVFPVEGAVLNQRGRDCAVRRRQRRHACGGVKGRTDKGRGRGLGAHRKPRRRDRPRGARPADPTCDRQAARSGGAAALPAHNLGGKVGCLCGANWRRRGAAFGGHGGSALPPAPAGKGAAAAEEGSKCVCHCLWMCRGACQGQVGKGRGRMRPANTALSFSPPSAAKCTCDGSSCSMFESLQTCACDMQQHQFKLRQLMRQTEPICRMDRPLPASRPHQTVHPTLPSLA